MATNDLLIRLIAKDQASAQINQVERSLDGLKSAFATLGIGLGLSALGKATYDLTVIGAQADTIRQSFDALSASTGTAGDEIVAAMRKASNGAVSEIDLMITANRAMLAGGKDLAENLPQLFEIARAAALSTGNDIDYVFSTLIRGIVKASPLLIDNADIYIQVGAAVEQYAASVGKTTDALSAAERQQAVLNAVLSEGGEFIRRTGLDSKTAAEDVQSLSAAWRDVKVAIGEALVEAGAADFLGNMASGIQDVTAYMDDLQPRWRELREEYIKLASGAEFDPWKPFSDDFLESLAQAREQSDLNAMFGGIEGKKIAVMQLEQQLLALTASVELLRAQAAGPLFPQDAGFADLSGEALALARSMTEVSAQSPVVVEVIDYGIDAVRSRLDGLLKSMVGVATNAELLALRTMAAMELDTMARGNPLEAAWDMERVLLGIRDIATARRAGMDDEVETVRGGLREIDDLYGDARSRIESVMQSGLRVTEQDRWLTDAGLYQDAPLEAARRLADIANLGLQSPWASFFEIPQDILDRGQDAVRAWASGLQADVEALARPDLIDWDAFVREYQEQLDREAARGLTMDIAMVKLAEAGLLQGDEEENKRKVAKALGLDTAPEIDVSVNIAGVTGATDIAAALEKAIPPAARTVPVTIDWQETVSALTVTPPVVEDVTLTPVATIDWQAVTTGPLVTLPTVDDMALTPNLYLDWQIIMAQTPGVMVGSIREGIERLLSQDNPANAFLTALSTGVQADVKHYDAIGQRMGVTIGQATRKAVVDSIGNIRADIAGLVAPEVAQILSLQNQGALQ